MSSTQKRAILQVRIREEDKQHAEHLYDAMGTEFIKEEKGTGPPLEVPIDVMYQETRAIASATNWRMLLVVCKTDQQSLFI